MTYFEKLYRPNKAIKHGRRHIITAYKSARKISPIPGYTTRGITHMEDEKIIGKEQ